MSLVLTSDFTGQYKIPKDCFDSLADYILKYEKEYLLSLLGAELYDLFIADLDGGTPQQPQTTRFIDIYNEFRIDDGACVYFSEGMRKMLVQFIYYHFAKDLQFQNTSSGTRVTDAQSSTKISYNGWNLVEAYNEGIRNYKAICWYLSEYSTDYPEENSQYKDYISGI